MISLLQSEAKLISKLVKINFTNNKQYGSRASTVVVRILEKITLLGSQKYSESTAILDLAVLHQLHVPLGGE